MREEKSMVDSLLPPEVAAKTEIGTVSLYDALPIIPRGSETGSRRLHLLQHAGGDRVGYRVRIRVG